MSTLLLFFMIVFNFCSVLCGLSQGYGTPYTTQLTANVDSSQTTIPVSSTNGFAMSDYVWVDSERIAYASTDATDFLNCTRAQADQNGLGATPASHNMGTQIYTQGMSALNSLIGFNYSSLQLSYGNPVAIILSISAYVTAIPRYISWNIGFMSGSGWSLIKIIILYPISAAFVITLLFFLTQVLWMTKPSVL